MRFGAVFCGVQSSSVRIETRGVVLEPGGIGGAERLPAENMSRTMLAFGRFCDSALRMRLSRERKPASIAR